MNSVLPVLIQQKIIYSNILYSVKERKVTRLLQLLRNDEIIIFGNGIKNGMFNEFPLIMNERERKTLPLILMNEG